MLREEHSRADARRVDVVSARVHDAEISDA
jgi:hypothetical protein